MKVARAAIGTLLLVAGTAWAHRAPNSVVSLDFTPGSVRAELLVPISELAYATAADTPGEDFAVYLLRHVAVESPAGARWAVKLRAVRKMNMDGHDYWVARLDLTPPSGASAREFVFIDDAVTHEVRNHVITVLARSDAAADSAPAARLLGMLQYPSRRLTIRRPP
jgi:hypothetical protein